MTNLVYPFTFPLSVLRQAPTEPVQRMRRVHLAADDSLACGSADDQSALKTTDPSLVDCKACCATERYRITHRRTTMEAARW